MPSESDGCHRLRMKRKDSAEKSGHPHLDEKSGDELLLLLVITNDLIQILRHKLDDEIEIDLIFLVERKTDNA